MPFGIFYSWSFAVPIGDHFRSGIICGPIWGSFAAWDQLRTRTVLKCIHKVENTSEKKRPFPQCLHSKSPCHFKIVSHNNLSWNLKVIITRKIYILAFHFVSCSEITIIQSLKCTKQRTLRFRSFFTSKCRQIFSKMCWTLFVYSRFFQREPVRVRPWDLAE